MNLAPGQEWRCGHGAQTHKRRKGAGDLGDEVSYKHAATCIKQTDSGKSLHNTESPAWHCDNLERWDWGKGGRLKMEGICIYNHE